MAITKNSQIDLNGNEMILDADGDTTITADTDDQLDIKVAGSDKVQINATGLGIGQVPTRDLSLHAGDASSVFAHFTNTDTGTTSSDGLLIGLGSSEDLVLNNQESSKNIIIENGGSERMRIDSSGDVGIGTSTINSGTLGSNNKFLEVAAGTASGSGTLILSRATNTNNDEVGGIRYVNANNADDDGLDADGKMIAAISSRLVTSDSNAGDDSGGVLTFSTKPEAGSFTERMRILSDGSIGINTTSPNQMFHVHGGRVQVTRSTDINEFGFIEQDASGNAMGIFTNGGAIRFGANGTSTEHMRIDSSGNVGIGTSSPNAYTNYTVLTIDSPSSGTGSVIDLEYRTDRSLSMFSEGQLSTIREIRNYPLAFGTNNTERMRIDSSGYLYVGTTSRIASGTVNVENVGVANCFTGKTSNNDYYIIAGSNNADSTTSYIRGNGNYYFAGTNQSDKDLKENIQTITESSLAKVKLLEPKTFNFKASEGFETNTKTGFIAQEVAEIFGTETGVASGTDGKKDMGVDTTGIVAHLTKAIQEQQEQIEALQSEINTLKGE